ncbi:hypothetical protein LguiB_033008 [Lonicera macranthoides]
MVTNRLGFLEREARESVMVSMLKRRNELGFLKREINDGFMNAMVMGLLGNLYTIVPDVFVYSNQLLGPQYTYSPTTPANPTVAAEAAKKPKRKEKKNLFEITKINLYKDGRHGKAWGIVHNIPSNNSKA